MDPSKLLAKASEVISKVPPSAFTGLYDLLSALVSGDAGKAERLARVTAAAVAAEELVKRRFPK